MFFVFIVASFWDCLLWLTGFVTPVAYGNLLRILLLSYYWSVYIYSICANSLFVFAQSIFSITF